MINLQAYNEHLRNIAETINGLARRVRELEAAEIPASGSVGPHAILSSTHIDSTPQVVSRGSLIYGNATPVWDELVIGGIVGSVVTRNADDVLWSTYALSGTAAQTYTFPAVSVAIPGGSGTVGRITQWQHATLLQDSTLIKSGAGVLTLSAAGAYTLTVPATGTVALGTGAANQVAYWSGANALTGAATFAYDPTASPNMLLTAANAAHIPLVVRLAAAHTANAIEVQTSADAVVANITPTGNVLLSKTLDTGYLSIGLNPSTIGSIRLPHNSSMSFRNLDNDGNVVVFFVAAGNQLRIGSSANPAGAVSFYNGSDGYYFYSAGSGSTYAARIIDGTIRFNEAKIDSATYYFAQYINGAVTTSPILSVYGNGRDSVLIGAPNTALTMLCGITNYADKIALIIKSFSTQTKNLTEWQTSAAAILSKVTAAGWLGVGVAAGTVDRLLHAEASDAVTNTITYATRRSHTTSGTAAAGFGVGHEDELQDAAGNMRVASYVETLWNDPAAATYKADLVLRAVDSAGTREGLRIRASGAAPAVGLYGAAPVARATTGVSEAAFTENAGGTVVNDDSAFGGYTLRQVVQALQNIGILT